MMEITNFKIKNHLIVITSTGCYVNIVLPAQWSHVSRGELEGNNTSSTIPSRLSASLCAQCNKMNFKNLILFLKNSKPEGLCNPIIITMEENRKNRKSENKTHLQFQKNSWWSRFFIQLRSKRLEIYQYVVSRAKSKFSNPRDTWHWVWHK